MTEAGSPFDLDGQLAIVTGASSGLGGASQLAPYCGLQGPGWST